MTADDFATVRKRLALGAARATRSADEITVAAPIGAAYVDSQSQRRQFVEQYKVGIARVIVGTWAIEEQRDCLAEDFPEDVKAVEAAWARAADPMDAMPAAVAAVTDEMVESRTIVGARTPKEIHKVLVELKTLGIDLPMLPMPIGKPDEAGRILEEMINA